MKKYSWIIVLLLALSFTIFFNSCGADFDPEKLNPGAWVISEGDIELITIGTGTTQTVDGNTYTINSTAATSMGFKWVPPDTKFKDPNGNGDFAWTDFQKVRVTIKILDINKCDGVSYAAKENGGMGNDVNRWGETEQYKNEVCIVGGKDAELYEDYPVKDFDGEIAFQYNTYAGDLDPSTRVTPDHKISVNFAFWTGKNEP